MNLSEALSSQARFEVLQALSPLEGGLGLRELERFTQLGIRSIQVSTQGLLKEGVLKKNQQGVFSLNPRSPIISRLRGLFEYLRSEEQKAKARALSKRAKQVVRLCDEVRGLVHRQRKL